MIAFTEMDKHVTIADQLKQEGGPLVLINLFNVDPEQSEELVSAWADDAAYMKSRPGYIESQLHQGIAGSGAFLNYAVWESVDHFRRAFQDPSFRSKLDQYPSSAVASPHLFRKVAVANVCVS